MADTKISALTDGGFANTTDEVAINRSGTSFKAKVAPQTLAVIEKTANHTLEASDAHKFIEGNHATGLNITVPPNSSVAFDVGTQITFQQTAAGAITFVQGSGVTIRSSETLKTRKSNSMATLIKTATDTWALAGDLEESP